jgi:hypothetical protein
MRWLALLTIFNGAGRSGCPLSGPARFHFSADNESVVRPRGHSKQLNGNQRGSQNDAEVRGARRQLPLIVKTASFELGLLPHELRASMRA